MQNQKENDEKLYMRAKEAYYNGNPIMSDAEFDALEEKLKQQNDNITLNVGAWDRRAKIKHPTPMLSLSKIQADKETGEAPEAQFNKWLENAVSIIRHSDKFKSFPDSKKDVFIEYTQKLDGNAINVIYVDGVVKHALSRGDGKLGRDYLPRLIEYGQFPKTISWTKDKVVEVRCEAVIAKDIFEKKYSKGFANERNYVAGILNSDDSTSEQLSEIDLIPVEVRAGNENGEFHNLYIEVAGAFGFKSANELIRRCVNVVYNDGTQNKSYEFKQEFKIFNSLKENGKYRVDGMVAKIDEKWRSVLGENEHDPNWGLAIKFKPEDCITEVTGFTMEMGKTGEITPVALLKPVDLDGSTVTKASAYNYRFIEENHLNVGSLVTLVKSGDIIPQIINVINDVGNPYDIGSVHCPYCGTPLKVKDGIHIHCPNENCEGKSIKQFINSMNALDVFGCGDAMCEVLFNYISTDPFYYLTTPKESILYALKSEGILNKNLSKFVDEVKSKTSISLETVIAMMSYEGISNDGKTVKEVAKKLAGLVYDFKGLEKKVVSGWEEGEQKRTVIEERIQELEYFGIEVVYPTEKKTKPSDKVIKITLRGSPKEYGYATKSVFVKHLEELGYTVEEVDIKKCDILFTDSMDSKTEKLRIARLLGKKIKTYGDF